MFSWHHLKWTSDRSLNVLLQNVKWLGCPRPRFSPRQEYGAPFRWGDNPWWPCLWWRRLKNIHKQWKNSEFGKQIRTAICAALTESLCHSKHIDKWLKHIMHWWGQRASSIVYNVLIGEERWTSSKTVSHCDRLAQHTDPPANPSNNWSLRQTYSNHYLLLKYQRKAQILQLIHCTAAESDQTPTSPILDFPHSHKQQIWHNYSEDKLEFKVWKQTANRKT